MKKEAKTPSSQKKTIKKSKKNKKEKKKKNKRNETIKNPRTNARDTFLRCIWQDPIPVMEALEEHGYVFPENVRFDQNLGDALIEKKLLGKAHEIWTENINIEEISEKFSDFMRENNLAGYFSIIENDPLTGDIFF